MYMFTSVHHEHVEVRNTSGWEENFLKHNNNFKLKTCLSKKFSKSS
jgi:hypothetical protein